MTWESDHALAAAVCTVPIGEELFGICSSIDLALLFSLMNISYNQN